MYVIGWQYALWGKNEAATFLNGKKYPKVVVCGKLIQQ
jgi:hypothetical protein